MLPRTVRFALVFSVVGALSAAAQSAQAVLHSPAEIEARPPLHIKPYLTASPAGYAPAQVRHAYQVDQLSTAGAGQIIAIVDAYGSPTIQNDLAKFCAAYGLPAATLKIYYPQGQSGSYSSGWALETSLDVEWAHAVAPQATIALVIAKSASLTNLLGAVDYAVSLGAKQVSMSWGSAEFSTEASYDTHFNKSGVTFVASSGDNGAGVEWPAASPYVVGVGGTSLYLDSVGNVSGETAWSGSGGGVSLYEKRPSYQYGFQSASGRGVPDVSYAADPSTGFSVYIGNYNGSAGWITVGGTSAGAPQWGALMALTNSLRTRSLSGADTAIYSTAVTYYAGNFRDITSGNNGAYNAGLGYDYVTGLGSPLSKSLVPTLSVK